MRNMYGAVCYFCNKYCAPGKGHFERYYSGWRVIHVDCCFDQRLIKYLNKELSENE